MAGSPSVASLFAQRVVVGVGDLAVSNNVQVVLSTYALGSCIGVVAYDPARKIGGLLHLMLPESAIAPEKAARQPAMFADTGLVQFFRQLGGLKAERSAVRVFVAGGASVIAGQDNFRIGERNTKATLAFLQQHAIRVALTDVGGIHNRTLHLEVSTGAVTIKKPSSQDQVSLAA
ncbi:MAG: chemotaxis protein CheD [Opitutaceae bacterium]|nr:chemotaxis protein CheD [Opitutaceae bacterium]